MAEKEKIKFYLIYYKKHQNNLYAWTLEKEKVNRFLTERCKDCFYIKKKKMDGTLSSVFMSQHPNLKLVDVPLFDGKEYITIIGTNAEDNAMQDAADNIIYDIYGIKSFIHGLPFKDKYFSVIDKLCEISKKDDDGDEYMQLNLFDLFINIHKETFTK